MSLINKMLEDLDRRNASVGQDAAVPPGTVRVVGGAPRGREWFWRAMAALMLVAVAWVAWVAYNLQPRTVATDAAFKAAEQARSKGPIATGAAPKPAASVEAKKAEAPRPEPARVESMKFALAIETPPAAPQGAVEKPAPAPAKATPAAKEAARPPELPSAGTPPKVVRHDRVRTPREKAESEFRRAAALLNQGRGPEAEEGFAAALQADRGHQAARQALIALNLERGQLEAARRLLQEGIAIDPANAEFAVALGRIQVEAGDLSGALATLQGAASADHAGVQVLRGTVLQRLGRHAEAAAAYRSALRLQTENPPAWIGLGISLEALKQRAEAADAFQRALAAGPANPELRVFAEQRIRALR